jgi:Flp pilus assembly pilin Flp
MRRPCLASSPKRNRNRVLKNASRKQTCGRPRRRLSPRLPIGLPQGAPGAPQISAATEAPNSAAAEVAACEPMRCGFGAVRVGALLGRLRLHLQTERFLAVHRGDTMWERGCLGAALALAVMVAGMQEADLDAALATSFSAASSRSGGTLRRTKTPNLRGGESEFGGGRPRYSAGLQPGISARGDVNAALKGSATSTGVKRGAR